MPVPAAQPLAEQYKFIVIAPECADPSAWVSWQVSDAASPPTLDQEHALVRHLASSSQHSAAFVPLCGQHTPRTEQFQGAIQAAMCRTAW